jgi:IclR family transcriptional regulator, acetate operon repressor
VARESGTGGVQSVQRAFEILEVMAAGGGGAFALSDIAAATGRPAPSIHRLIRTLVELGYVRQDSSRRYALAPGLIRLGDSAARQFGTWAEPLLSELVEAIGETANMAILEGTHALYVAQVAGRHSMRMFTEVGRRVPLHSTGVGKALLSQLSDQDVRNLLAVAGMPAATDRTITDPEALIRELAAGRALGHVSEDGEQELGVSCVAVPVPGVPVLTAISFSGPAPRMTSDAIRRAATALQAAAGALADRFTERASTG